MSMTTPVSLTRRFLCGPVCIEMVGDGAWIERLSGELLMFDVPFDGPSVCVRFEISEEMEPAPEVRGNYLQFHRYKVDRTGDGFVMSSPGGAWCRFDAAARCARVRAPYVGDDVVEEVEQFLIFVLVWGWQVLGWMPLHVATIEWEGKCVLVCAESCGGKSTFTAACIRRGFHTLGDDKVLIGSGRPAMACALSRGMNLDPAVARWFPEVAGISELRPYSRWSAKRKVRIEDLWPGATRARAMPTVLLKLTRAAHSTPVFLRPLGAQEVIDAIARQTVIPNDRLAAAAMLPAILGLAEQLRGWAINVTAEAYSDLENLKGIEEIFT
jgi:hypothetical protein